MLAAELVMSRRECLHVEWRVRPRVVRRHGAINLNLAEVIVGFKQGNANRLGENGSIAALIANRIVFDHRQAMKRGGAARCGAGAHRGIEAARYAGHYGINAEPPAFHTVERTGAKLTSGPLPHLWSALSNIP